MYLETYSMEELMELIEEKGYCSVEAVEILKEMEQAKKEYDFLLRDCEKKEWKTDQVVVDYYRYLLEELRKACPMMLWEGSIRFRFWCYRSSVNRTL